MNYVYLVILLALLQFLYFTFRVGASRGKYGVHAPSTAGHETWERIYRVQQNTMEQLLMFIPGMLAFAYFVSPLWALLPGVAYLAGRQVYSYHYVVDPKKRGPGMALSFFANTALIFGAIAGLLAHMRS